MISLKTFYNIFLDEATREDIKKYYPKIDNTVYNKILDADSTGTKERVGNLSRLVLDLYKKDEKSFKIDDSAFMHDVYTAFDVVQKKKNNLTGTEFEKYKNLNNIPNIKTLMDINHYIVTNSTKKIKVRSGEGENYEVFFENDTWEVLMPKDYKTSVALGRSCDAVWCTASSDADSYFKSYTKDDDLYIFRNKKNPKLGAYQYSARLEYLSPEFNDERNNHIDVNRFASENGLEGVFKKIYKKIEPLIIKTILLKAKKNIDPLMELKESYSFIIGDHPEIFNVIKEAALDSIFIRNILTTNSRGIDYYAEKLEPKIFKSYISEITNEINNIASTFITNADSNDASSNLWSEFYREYIRYFEDKKITNLLKEAKNFKKTSAKFTLFFENLYKKRKLKDIKEELIEIYATDKFKDELFKKTQDEYATVLNSITSENHLDVFTKLTLIQFSTHINYPIKFDKITKDAIKIVNEVSKKYTTQQRVLVDGSLLAPILTEENFERIFLAFLGKNLLSMEEPDRMTDYLYVNMGSYYTVYRALGDDIENASPIIKKVVSKHIKSFCRKVYLKFSKEQSYLVNYRIKIMPNKEFIKSVIGYPDDLNNLGLLCGKLYNELNDSMYKLKIKVNSQEHRNMLEKISNVVHNMTEL